MSIHAIQLSIEATEACDPEKNGVIHKETFSNREVKVIDLPKGTRVISAGAQGDNLAVWFLKPLGWSSAPLYGRVFETHVTGWAIPNPDQLNFIGTAVLQNGEFVLHLFERRP